MPRKKGQKMLRGIAAFPTAWGFRVPKMRTNLSLLQEGKPCSKNEARDSLANVPLLQSRSTVFPTSRTEICREAEATAVTQDFS